MVDRVVVFYDWQNVYRSAREAFHDHLLDPSSAGQVNPLSLAEHLAASGPADRTRELAGVRIYRGQPSSTRDPVGYGAFRRQESAWRTLSDLVVPVPRPLRYPEGWPDRCDSHERPQEKGIDVVLAVDLVTMARDRLFDVAIVFSGDTDLLPALEYAAGLTRAHGRPRIEVAAFSAPGYRRRLTVTAVPGVTAWCHWIQQDVYLRHADHTAYSRASEPAGRAASRP